MQFTPDVKLFVVLGAGQSQTFMQARRATELTGHKAGVFSFCFSVDSRLAATVSKDGSWRLFNLECVLSLTVFLQSSYVIGGSVDWLHGAECKIIAQNTFELSNCKNAVIALSPDMSLLPSFNV